MNNKIRYPELDALRGVAVLMVLLYHFSLNTLEAAYGFKFGLTGVELFFLISGFVISCSINNVKNSLHFVINRFCRLFPTYWASVSFTFSIICLYNYNKGIAVDWNIYWTNMTMVQHYLSFPDLDITYWTMIIELLFYLFMVLVYSAGLIKYLRLCSLCFCLVILYQLVFSDKQQMLVFCSWLPLIEFFPLFYSGILFYQILVNNKNTFLSYLLIFFCFIIQCLLFDLTNRSNDISEASYYVLLFLFYIVFVLFVNGKLKWIILKPLLLMGKISFSLYLIHYYFSCCHLIPWIKNNISDNFWIYSFCFALPANIIIAALITNVIEIPINRKWRKLLIQ